MHYLVPFTLAGFNPPLSYALAIGIVIFLCSLFLLFMLFGFSIAETAKHGTTLGVVLVLSMIIPYTIRQTHIEQYKDAQADQKIIITDLQFKKVDELFYTLSFKTDQPAYAYLQYEENGTSIVSPVLPDHPVAKYSEHIFNIRKTNKGGQVYIVINGNRYTVDNKPLVLQ